MNAPFSTPTPARLTASETFIVAIRDRATGKLTYCETDVGESLKDAAGYLALGMVPCGFHPAGVVSTATGDVTARVLHEVACICEAEDRELDPRLVPLFAAYDVPLPVPAPVALDDEEHRLGAWDVLGGRAA